MPKFIVEETSPPEQPFIISLVKEDYGVSVRIRQGQSENIRLLEFHDDGRVIRYINRVRQFKLRSIMGSTI